MRVLAACLLTLALAAPGAASAQDKPRPRIVQPPPKVDVAPPTAPPPRTPLAPLRMGGLPPAPDGGGTCRATCSKERYSCSGEDDASDCSNRWLTCLSLCRGR